MTARTRPPQILLTGFEPFGGDAVNPSWLVAQALHGEAIAGARVQALCLPCVFGQALTVLQSALHQHRPQVVLALGLAAVRNELSVERVALNVNDARFADNAGAQPIDTPVDRNGPTAYFTSLPIKAMLLALQGAGIAAEVSQTAGTFVCNHVFYGLMHALATQPRLKKTRGGFIHVPWLPEQGSPNLPLEVVVSALRLAIATALQTQRDISAGAGVIS